MLCLLAVISLPLTRLQAQLSDTELDQLLADELGLIEDPTESTAEEPMQQRLSDEELDMLLDELLPETSAIESGAWFHDVSVDIALGYDDNPLSNAFIQEGSSFSRFSAEYFGYQNDEEKQRERMAIIFFEHYQFFDAEDYTNDDLLSLVLQNKRTFANGFTWGQRLEGIYFDTLIDVSSDINLGETTLLSYFEGNFISSIESPTFWKEWYAYSEASIGRIVFEEDSGDDGTLAEFRLGISNEQLPIGELSIEWEWSIEHSDVLTVRDEFGFPSATSDERFEVYFSTWQIDWKKDWGKEDRWQTKLRLQHRTDTDNGPGYADVVRYKIRPSLRYTDDRWTCSASLAYGDQSYKVRLADTSQNLTETLERQTWNFDLKLERDITNSLITYIEYSHCKADANRPEDNYESNRVVAGINFFL